MVSLYGEKERRSKMNKLIMLTIMVLALVFVSNQSAVSGCGGCGGAKAFAQEAKDEIINDVCPVMGGAVGKDTPYKVEYGGKTIGFCCAGCIGMFNKDPEKYMAKLGLEEKTK